ncbi:MAG: VWA domain-containing protein [Acidobacteria bacterium]|nr:MAG: VWA domain-containing protein [Acidobacteriota bacterium]REJ99310.1 MAG: VWA domain-containing protein [Acidobacteriota bacterium]REK15970.1 MAG: VWA domain-containing protein [Acidobacteriota bacterium]REK43651.1 MAG: VWA domain-containing protein [Acidobacteriota bacterium]
MRDGRPLVLALILFLTALVPAVRGQDGDVIKIDTDLVSFEVSVTDNDGNPVRGLTAEDFNLFVDGKQRQIDFFKPIRKDDSGRPLSVVFALDVSGSITRDELINLRNAMQTFVGRLADYHSYFAITTFGMEVKTVQSFTNKPNKLKKSFEKILKDQDGLSTHAYDAVDEAVRMLRKKSPPMIRQQIPKRVVIVVTDGYPVGDTVTPATVIERANDAETSVYAVILPSYSRLSGGNKPVLTLLEASGLIEKTGGRSFYATENDFEPLFKALAEEITASYAVAFYPPESETRQNRFYRVNIESAKGFSVIQNKSGYSLKDKD